MKEMLEDARINHYDVPAFDVSNYRQYSKPARKKNPPHFLWGSV
jgi:hypothetical protein